MENSKKDLLNFISTVETDNDIIGVYYIDKAMDIVHYSLYTVDELNILREKIAGYNEYLEDDLVKILLWRKSTSKDYLIGVYDGLCLKYKSGVEDDGLLYSK